MKVELYDNRVLSLTGEIECDDPPLMAAALHGAKGKNIRMYISSTGGVVTAAWAMYDLIRAYPGWVTTVAVGDCHSASATFLLQAGDHRTMTQHSVLVFHEGTPGGCHDSWSNAKAWISVDTLQHVQAYKFLLDIIRKVKPQFTEKELTRKMQSDWILTAEEALEWGLIDEILTVLP